MPDYLIRSERVSDIPKIRFLIEQAFSRKNEAQLVNDLRDSGALTFSLVAEKIFETETEKKAKDNNELLGHLALSLVSIENENRRWQALGLAPLSVMPQYQKQGIGSALINFWFNEYAVDFYNAVVLLGNPNYYKHFGFLNASHFGLHLSEGNFDAEFQVREIKKDFLKNAEGKVFYNELFTRL
jgi:putative acetyltransferase